MHEIHSDIESIRSLEPDWTRLSKLMKSPLLSYEWFISCIRSLQDNQPIKIIVIRDNAGISAIAPLWLVSNNGIEQLEIIGVRELYEPSGLLYKDNSALSELINAMLSLDYPITLLRIPSDAPIVELAKSNKRCFPIVRPTAKSQYIEIDKSWDTYFHSLSKNRRSDLRRKWSKLEKKGALSVKIITPTDDSLEEELMLAFSIEDQSWKGKSGTSLLKNKSLLSFFINYARLANNQGNLRIFFLCLDETPIAMHVTTLEFDTLWILKLGYVSNYGAYSPGNLLTSETIKYAHDEKLRHYEFLGSSESRQTSWTQREHDYCTILLFPYSIKNMYYLVVTTFHVFYQKLF